MARWKILGKKGDIPERYEARGNETYQHRRKRVISIEAGGGNKTNNSMEISIEGRGNESSALKQ